MADKTHKALIGTKVGMTQIWDDTNKVVPVTVIKVETNVVSQVKTVETDTYASVQIAAGAVDPRRVNKPKSGHFAKAGVTPRRYVEEVNIQAELGQELSVDVFEAGELVDVVATSKGKGFAGTMKRHNFAGVGASHGAHRNHRKPGSIGASATPGRVFKGTRMSGRMGASRVTVQNLRLVKVDAENSLLLIKGAVPGPKGCKVLVRDAVKGA